jgi:hypothetical protein
LLCPHCGGQALTSKRKVLGLSLFYCKACERKGVEGDSRWPLTGPGHEEQLFVIATQVVSENRRWAMWLDGELDAGGATDVFEIGGPL